MTWSEVEETQGRIIRMQSEIIDDLFILLMMHISPEGAAALPVMGKIRRAAELRERLGGE